MTTAQVWAETIAAGSQLSAQADRAILQDQIVGMRLEAATALTRHVAFLEQRHEAFETEAHTMLKRHPVPSNRNAAVDNLWKAYADDFRAAAADLTRRVEAIEKRREAIADKRAEREAALAAQRSRGESGAQTPAALDDPAPRLSANSGSRVALPSR